MNHETKARHDIAVTLYKRGKTIDYCAKVCGYGRDYIRQILTKEGIWETKPEIVEKKERKVIEMIHGGYNDEEIAKVVGYKSLTSVYTIAKKYGLEVVSAKAQEKESLHKEIVRLKHQGYTREEIAECLGVSAGMVTLYAKGINPQYRSPEEQSRLAKEQQQKTLREREEKARQLISQTGFEYVGGYVDTDSSVMIRCPECGNTFERSMVTFRHHDTVICPTCRETKKRERQEALRLQREKEAQERIECRKAAEERKREEKFHPCPVCGTLTSRKKYCSDKCAHKAANTRNEVKRRHKIQNVMVDKDITLPKLYERDYGICYLCGELCDWNDKEEREDGVIVCGDRYPSIDHVIPLAKGGEHSWQNVKLAHRKCNTIKGAKHRRIASSLITRELKMEAR